MPPLEAGLRAYPGRATEVNSVTAEDDHVRDFLPLAKIRRCHPLPADHRRRRAQDGRGPPQGHQYIVGKAKKKQPRGRRPVTALVATVSARQERLPQVLKTRKLPQRLGCPSTMGLSNISFGLPNRPLINSTFFAMCLAAGLDAPIMNPYDRSMQKAEGQRRPFRRRPLRPRLQPG